MSYKKWQSRRWWVCVWAITMTTIIIFWLMFSKSDPTWIGIAIALFQIIIVGYVAASSFTKPKGQVNE